MVANSHHGACLCGATRFEVRGSLDDVVLCHCTQCRRGNGGAFNVSVVVATDQVTFHDRASVKEYESSPARSARSVAGAVRRSIAGGTTIPRRCGCAVD